MFKLVMLVILIAAAIGGYVVYRELRDTGSKVEEKAQPLIDKARPALEKAREKAGPALDKAKRAGKAALDEMTKDGPDAGAPAKTR